jgi:glyoxylase-like metal-dependent hydrolase (beta-lactamase superfamily II)
VALIGLVACGTVWADPAELETTEVTASVVMARHPHGANITCIALDDGLVFVDTGLSTENAARFRAMMEAQFKRDTKALILTHAHLDHIFGMGAFSDVEVIAAASAKPMFEKQLAMKFDEEKTAVYTNVFPTFGDVIGSAEPFIPTFWVDEEFVLGRPGQQIVFKNTGGHTTGSSYVYFESEGVLVTGDLVQVEKYPYFGDPSNDLECWIRTLKQWYGLMPAKVCPGHGRVVDSEYLRVTWEYFESLIAELEKLKTDGVPLEEVVVHPSLPAGYWDPDLAEPGWWKYCIAREYQSL